MSVHSVDVWTQDHAGKPVDDPQVAALLREAGLKDVAAAYVTRLFLLEGDLDNKDIERIARTLLVDPVAETCAIRDEQPARTETGASQPLAGGPDGARTFEVHLRPGVMDTVAESTLAELSAAGFAITSVRTARRYAVVGCADAQQLLRVAGRVLANDCIELLVSGTAGVQPAVRPTRADFAVRHVSIDQLDHAGLERLSRDGHLFLSLDEMRAIQDYFRSSGRAPTDLELETLAQTWSEHCVHKTLKSAVIYRGKPFPGTGGTETADAGGEVEYRFKNLLRDTIARVTDELIEANRGPTCLSVFKDNAGVIAFDDSYGIAFKVETHNHPSAIEPYGGAATGVGGCIRDVIGCGLGAKPVANTDVFCVAPGDWDPEQLPKGVLHPRRVLRGIVRGVADYGNRMGIPTVNGAIHFDPRYLGNPLVYCGCVGLIPRHQVEKAAHPGDRIVVVGGRTGRDGIHGATFSSAELTDTHADEFSHAVQIGNPITEKRVLDAILRARDAEDGCLYNAITDCGAGGLSSAVGEMGETVGATVDLDNVPLKYQGLRYDEIWISEAQERMVVAVPENRLARFMEIAAEEEVEATVIGTFGTTAPDDDSTPLLRVRYQGEIVGELAMPFLHNGLPKTERVATWQGGLDTTEVCQAPATDADWPNALHEQLSRPTVAAKTWIIRQYDHEVQGGSVVKPLTGPGAGPADAAVLRPRLDSRRGIAIGCGLQPALSDIDPYWMAVASIDEALRNVVCVGGNPAQTAILDNFCWGRTDNPEQMGSLVRACQGCYDAAKRFGTPFISGKDSLNNEFALDAGDVDRLLDYLASRAAQDGASDAWLQEVSERVRATRRLAIPPTLLISAISLVDDVDRCITPDLKTPGHHVYLVGALPPVGASLRQAAEIHDAVAHAIRAGAVHACHDVSDGGWLSSVAEMCIAGDRGVALQVEHDDRRRPFETYCAGYVIETDAPEELHKLGAGKKLPLLPLGVVIEQPELRFAEATVTVAAMRASWNGA